MRLRWEFPACVGRASRKDELMVHVREGKADFGQSNFGQSVFAIVFGQPLLANPIWANPFLANPFFLCVFVVGCFCLFVVCVCVCVCVCAWTSLTCVSSPQMRLYVCQTLPLPNTKCVCMRVTKCVC